MTTGTGRSSVSNGALNDFFANDQTHSLFVPKAIPRRRLSRCPVIGGINGSVLTNRCQRQANTRNSLRGDLNVFDSTGGRGNRRAVLAHTLEMEFDRVPNGGFRLCERAASRYTTGQIRNVS